MGRLDPDEIIMALADYFAFFDPKQPYSASFGSLPHWVQPGATYFITFRLADSLPQPTMRRWRQDQIDWLRRRKLFDPRLSRFQLLARQPLEVQREFHRLFMEQLEAELDKNYGDCVLRQPDVARVVGDSLLYFDGFARAREIRYHVSDYVVMPNHVHLLVSFLAHVEMLKQCDSWKHFTAVRINRLLGRRGELWQSESFDHLVRDADQFQRFRKYIASNPRRAGLREGEYLQYRAEP